MSTCTLCDLPTPEPPVTDPDVEGTFCCRGCLEVSRTLDGEPVEGTVDPEAALETGPAVAEPEVDGEQAYVQVDGMHCATCEAFLESRAMNRPGIQAATASYPSGMMQIRYDPEQLDPELLPELVGGAGYEAHPIDTEHEPADRTGQTTGRLLVGGFFGMMTMVWYVLFLYPWYLGFPQEALLLSLSGPAGTYLLANIWVMTTVVLGYTGFPILRGAYVSLRAGHPNMDLLVGLAASMAYLYSVVGLFTGSRELYFDVVVVLVVVVTLGNYYETRVKERAAGHLSELTRERVTTARIRTDGGTEEIAREDVQPGDELVVKPGERIPLDGTVHEGTASVDESLVTGESVPARKEPGDAVIGGSRVVEGGLVIRVGDEVRSTVDRLTDVLWDIQSASHGAQRLADRIAAVFVPLVVLLAAITGIAHLWLGSAPTAALLTGLTVLVVSCPCALGLATPLAIASGLRESLDRGIVMTNASIFETAPDTDVVAFDKTGTMTAGQMSVLETVGPPDCLDRAAALEQFAGHPIADAIAEAGDPAGHEVREFESVPGMGVCGQVDGELVVVGRPALFDQRGWSVPADLHSRYEAARDDGSVPALVGWDGTAQGAIVAGDSPRAGWETVVDRLDEDGRSVVVLTGDDERAARRFEGHKGIDHVFAGVPPEAKASVIERLQTEEGSVTMVGDGTNDAPALATADLGISLERGTALAADAADAVAMTEDLEAVPALFEIANATRRRIRQNLGWAFAYNLVALPLAVFGLINPLLAAAAMAGSSLLVVVNSARSLV
ncbi:MAG: heavy metal translocating P-type ATPase [Halodesulfurarchaeum sp.]